MGPLVDQFFSIPNPKLKIQECWDFPQWDIEKLTTLVGEEIIKEIILSNVKWNNGSNLFIWKPNQDGQFTKALAWESIRLKGDAYNWWNWVWHSYVPKKVSLYMWNAFFNYLPVDAHIKASGVYMASAYNCYIERKDETLGHVLRSGFVASWV